MSYDDLGLDVPFPNFPSLDIVPACRTLLHLLTFRASATHRPGTNLTVDAYEIDIFTTARNIGCPGGRPTWFLSYNGSVPGPSFRVLKGRQTLVRFNNRLTPANLSGTPFSLQFDPCEGTRSGRPITVHLHGSSSLAPYDGERGTVIYLAEYKALRKSLGALLAACSKQAGPRTPRAAPRPRTTTTPTGARAFCGTTTTNLTSRLRTPTLVCPEW